MERNVSTGAVMDVNSAVVDAHPAAANAHRNADSTPPEALSDKDLYALCKEYGENARKWMRMFAFLLPEVARRGLHRKKGFESIYEFAGRLAGMSHNVVYRVLRLSYDFKAMPKLWNLVREYGWSKLQIVVSVATSQNEDFWIDKINTMSKGTLEVFVRELKKQENPSPQNLFDGSNFVPEKCK